MNKNNYLDVLNIFHNATGVGVIFFDRNLHLSASIPSKDIINDFLCLGMDQIDAFLSEEFSSGPVSKQNYYTFFLESNLVSNVCILHEGSTCAGAFVTQPVFIKAPADEEIDRILNKDSLSVKERNIMHQLLLKVPVVNYDRIMPMGRVLLSLSQTALTDAKAHQVLKGTSGSHKKTERKSVVFHDNIVTNRKRNHAFDYAIYTRLKEHIENGDPIGLSNFMSNISVGKVQIEKLIAADFIRSLRISFIKACAMGSLISMDCGVHFDKALDISDDAIRQMEKLENINEIYELMKNTVITFAQAVSQYRSLSHSKPVRLILDYIAEHYNEKITLTDLAGLTNFSTFYISSLLKKDTGLSLAENINRIRIEKSKKFLLETNLSILEVAQHVGFNYQNHFASIFKKQTGLSPTDYRNIAGIETIVQSSNTQTDSAFPPLLSLVQTRLSALSEYFDHARIIDITNRKTWSWNAQASTALMPNSCYEFWNKKEPCNKCISTAACIKGEIMFKVIDHGDEAFLTIAIPKTVGDKLFSIEIIKNITGHFVLDQDVKKNHDDSNLAEEKLGHKISENTIRKISQLLNHNRIIKEQLTLVIVQLSVENESILLENEQTKLLLRMYKEAVTSSFRNKEDIIETYLGDTFILILNKTGIADAKQIISQIEKCFFLKLSEQSIENQDIKLHYGMKADPGKATDAKTLFRMAFLNLKANRS